MIKLENTEITGWEATIRGMRNPMNSWDKSDSKFYTHGIEQGVWFHTINDEESSFLELKNNFDDIHKLAVNKVLIGPADQDLMMRLARAGSVDAKFRRMINVTVDITAPLYWWKEFDTYKVGTVANSCSTMHKIHAKEFELDDFSHEHLFFGSIICDTEEEAWDAGAFSVDHDFDPYGTSDDGEGLPEWYNAEYARDILLRTITALNAYRTKFLETKDKKYWWQMIQLLPTSYNQKRTVQLNYEVLAGIYPKRKNHKLDEWHDFCDWIKALPFSEVITLEEA